MHRLNFSLPEFTRIVWASDKAKKLWQPRIDAINRMWPKIERATVVSRMRQGGIANVTPEGLLEIQEYCFENDLTYSILSQVASVETYSSASQPIRAGKPWNYRVYYGVGARYFLEYWKASDDEAIGDYLGYPQCCSEFFHLHWTKGNWRDLTSLMFQSQGRADGPYQCNILLRHLGVRPVFHLPCSFTCDNTVRLANNILAYQTMGYDREMAWLIEILSWPIKWSSLHGVAIVTTPIVKVIYSTDPVAEKVEIVRDGIYPEGGVSGHEFPTPQKMALVMKDTWTDNGFTSYFAMKRAHRLVMQVLYKVPPELGRVIDLGCGNGALLDLIRENLGLSPFGVEVDAIRVENSGRDYVKVGNLYEPETYLLFTYSFALISVNRLLEVDASSANHLLQTLKQHVKYLIVYSYEGWKPDADSLVSDGFSLVGRELDGNTEARIFRSNENTVL